MDQIEAQFTSQPDKNGSSPLKEPNDANETMEEKKQNNVEASRDEADQVMNGDASSVKVKEEAQEDKRMPDESPALGSSFSCKWQRNVCDIDTCSDR